MNEISDELNVSAMSGRILLMMRANINYVDFEFENYFIYIICVSSTLIRYF